MGRVGCGGERGDEKEREKRKKHGITAISKLSPTEADLITIAL